MVGAPDFPIIKIVVSPTLTRAFLREGDELVSLCANGRGSPCSRAIGNLFVAVDRDRRVLRASAVRVSLLEGAGFGVGSW